MLIDRPPLASPADLIFCRNLLLYFSAPMRQKAFARLRAMAAPQSFLVLGAGETVLGQTDQFVASPRLRGLYEPADPPVRRPASRSIAPSPSFLLPPGPLDGLATKK